jgi:integrase/recombinase XerD
MPKGTLLFYRSKLKDFIEFCSSNNIQKVFQIEPTHIRTFILILQEKGHNPGGVHSYYRVIKAFLRWFENEYEPENWKNPIVLVKAPKNPVIQLDAVNIEVAQAIINVCPRNTFFGARDRAIIFCLLDTGLRASELCSMNIDDVNYITGEVHVLKGKGRKPRYVFLGSKSRKALRTYIRFRQDDNDALWLSRNHTRLGYWSLESMIHRRAKEANVHAPTLHSFRRWFALTCLRSGMDAFSLQELMGHADLQVLRRYIKQTSLDLQTAHQRASPVDNLY